MLCKVGLLLLMHPRDPDLLHHRLRHQQQADTIHLDAKSLQPRVSGGGEGNVPNSQGALTHLMACAATCSLCKQLFGVGSIPWSPLARGFLTRPLDQTSGTARGQTDRFINSYNVNDGIAQIVPRCVFSNCLTVVLPDLLQTALRSSLRSMVFRWPRSPLRGSFRRMV